MGPKPRISLEDKGKVLALSEEGYTQREIAARAGCTQSSVSEILKKKRLTGSVKDAKIPGRKRKTSTREDRVVVRKSKSNRFKMAPQIKAEMQIEHGVNISVSTTRRRLREAGLKDCKPRKKPRLTARHKKCRLQFAQAHKDWTPEQWSRVIFSDESRFLLHRSDGRVYVRRMAGEELKESCIQTTVKHGGGGIMVWSCINVQGVGCLSKIDEKLNGERYIDVLENSLIPTTHMLTIPNGWIFQQDNATCHTSWLVKEWFAEEGITVMEWPAQSPDLNPIENLWDHLKTTIQEQNPTNVKELWNTVKATWRDFPLNKIINLINSMSRRCEAVIKARGRATKY